MNSLKHIIEEKDIIVSCGSGGVGKTTVAAAIGVACASAGRRTCVITIDPARRLADALSAKQVSDDPVRIDIRCDGELYAAMFHAEHTFDSLVRRNAKDAEQAERILANRLYRNLASVLSGTQEYLATERLFELHESHEFDCIVIDTPPSRVVLDFLQSPERVASFIDNRLFRTLIAGSGPARAFNLATQVALRAVAKVTGAEIVDDAISFFQAFSGMEDGFRQRSAKVDELLRHDSTAFVLVSTPRREAADEATAFVSRLQLIGHNIDALVINRVYPDFGPALSAQVGAKEGPWADLSQNLNDFVALRTREQPLISGLASLVDNEHVITVPTLAGDVHDLDTLTSVARYLVSDDVAFRGGEDLYS